MISFLKEWCNDDKQVHVFGLTEGQILYLVLKACNSGDDKSIEAKRQELVRSLMYAMNYAKGTVVPETCFTGIIGAMLKSEYTLVLGWHTSWKIELECMQKIRPVNLLRKS